VRLRLFLVLMLLWTSSVQAQVIDRDSRWQGVLTFTEKVLVPAGVTLRVASGSHVLFDGGGLEVVGRLIAEQSEFSGDNWDGVTLLNCDATTRLHEVTIRGAKTGLLVKGGAPQLEKLTLQGNQVGLELRGKATGSLSSARFVDNAKVGLFIKDESSTRVTDSLFRDNPKYGAYIYRSQPAQFANNRFELNGTGLMIAYHGTDPLVENNLFINNETAIQVDRAARPVLRGNRLNDNRTGLYLYRRSDPVVQANLFNGNQVAILVAYSSYPRIEENDFVENPLAIKLEYQSSTWEQTKGASARSDELASQTAFGGQGMRTVSEEQRQARQLDGTIAAGNNWWGEPGTAELDRGGASGNPSFIHDGKDQATFREGDKDYPLDRVDFSPWSHKPLTEFSP